MRTPLCFTSPSLSSFYYFVVCLYLFIVRSWSSHAHLSSYCELANQVAKVATQLVGLTASASSASTVVSLMIIISPFTRLVLEMALGRSVDIVVGIPGRVIDHLDRVLPSLTFLPQSRNQFSVFWSCTLLCDT